MDDRNYNRIDYSLQTSNLFIKSLLAPLCQRGANIPPLAKGDEVGFFNNIYFMSSSFVGMTRE